MSEHCREFDPPDSPTLQEKVKTFEKRLKWKDREDAFTLLKLGDRVYRGAKSRKDLLQQTGSKNEQRDADDDLEDMEDDFLHLMYLNGKNVLNQWAPSICSVS